MTEKLLVFKIITKINKTDREKKKEREGRKQ